MEPNNTHLSQMVAAAREYCELIENMDTTDCLACMTAMSHVLPRLDRAAAGLPSEHPATAHTTAPDFDARFELFSRIRGALGKVDSYQLEFDQAEQDHSGSLADDFTDIYFDLRYGLDLLEADPENADLAAASWQTSHKVHWHEHVRGASTQLAAILKRYQAQA